ncbi:DNA-binding ferritin-like protein (Dps family) [Clostridium acetobutylicum]|uniref:Membrane protein n=1 Tax=Clostridium acetobutylicum (strain ATCC 824 / DSM 792 / JCM 1419 / IAM 19013 / LMG 5710 / NBRC 13948 / NRRL B-527 / VKM B-1787 / 2291 / W) TaxID=272562 RepID=Q97TF0_CLOAB|nr:MULTISPECIES: DUF1048 domain-containing protein [Clostridium]AAK76899.1 Membrane protein [Clostridium acetobutylicum ATCC 824]ADZ22936.1 Membrane protein [Clostridium acetobutylicum EA 2018]AEI34895.1 hypothetical protein SMB_P152 [Clostridium acetobutylicum DSM 1731]AWV82441.1 DUF1048 domain-containing protein [Clostridium acetobutylicum]MBC2395715.1 DUF1048 domain-containing protein [Clostridium acetobutylicum]
MMNELDAMIKKNYEMSKKLNEANDKVYTNILCYIRVSSLDAKEKEEIISDILEMFLRCQAEEKSIDELIGNDYKSFCDSIIESAGENKFSKENIKETLYIIINGIFILLSINFIFDYVPRAIKYRSIVNYKLGVSFLLTTTMILLIAFGIVKYIGKTSFNDNNISDSKKAKILFIIFYVVITVILGLIGYILRTYTLFSANPYVMLAILAVYWIYKLLERFRKEA